MKTQSVSEITSKIVRAKSDSRYRTIYENKKASGKNEFLMFIKPEITMMHKNISYENIINYIVKKISLYDLSITSIKIIASDYIKAHQIIADHYGLINRASTNARKCITEKGIECFETEFNADFNKVKFLGGHEFLNEYNFHSAQSLDMLWSNSSSVKLCSGMYCANIKYRGEEIYLINGFHPTQLEHFEENGRFIITLNLRGDTSWATARDSLIGSTDPAKAKDGSIRNTLLKKKKQWGLKCINSNWNGVHLSAGPIEALTELIRFNSNLDFSSNTKLFNYELGRDLISSLGIETAEAILTNPIIVLDEKESNVYDCTEETDSDKTLAILKSAFKNKLVHELISD